MKTLYIVYDGKCAFCRRCRAWLGLQPAYVALAFIPLQSPEIAIRFPGIGAMHPDERLVVISDAGEIRRGECAWVTCLWALREYREWSFRLANPILLPFARQVCELVSVNRHVISRWIIDEPVERLRDRLAATAIGECVSEGYRKAQ